MVKDDEKLNVGEVKARFEAALRGARAAGPAPMKSFSPKVVTKDEKRRKTKVSGASPSSFSTE